MLATAPLPSTFRAAAPPSSSAYTPELVQALLRRYFALGFGPLALGPEAVTGSATTQDAHGHKRRKPVNPQGGFELGVCTKVDLEMALASLIREDWGWRGGQYVLIWRDSFDLRAVFGHVAVDYSIDELATLFRCDRAYVARRYRQALDDMARFLNRGGERRPWSLVAAILKPLGWLD